MSFIYRLISFLNMCFYETLWRVILYDEIFGFYATERLTRNKPGYIQIREANISVDPPHIIPLHSYEFLSRFSCEKINLISSTLCA